LAALGKAIKVVKSSDPVKVAYALEGLKVTGLNGEMEMRASDHQIQQPLYVMSWVKADVTEVRFDQENTGFGWKTAEKLEPFVAAQPTSCQMKRPGK